MRLLLHTCCGPCLLGSIDHILDYDITVLYYNPNLSDENEYNIRLQALKTSVNYINSTFNKNIDIIAVDFNPTSFYNCIRGYERCVEGGERCKKCIYERMEFTAKLCSDKFDIFATTLTLSPHKDCEYINTIGKGLAMKYNTEYLPSNFKKNDGFLKSVRRSKELNIYRQKYCGCIYSRVGTIENEPA